MRELVGRLVGGHSTALSVQLGLCYFTFCIFLYFPLILIFIVYLCVNRGQLKCACVLLLVSAAEMIIDDDDDDDDDI